MAGEAVLAGNQAGTAIITGAAGNLGKATATCLSRAGMNLILLDLDRDAVTALVSELGEAHLALSVDLTDRDAVAACVDKAIEKYGSIDALCALAGGFSMGSDVHEAGADEWRRMHAINVDTLLSVASAVVPHMIERKAGRIVTVGAAAAVSGKAAMGPYIASKSAVMRITESMAGELKQHGIGVNSVLPSVLDTPQNREAMPKADPGNWVDPDALAEIVLFLISPQAAAVNGALIPVTGRG